MTDKPFRIVGFAGPKYSGKDTAAKALFNLNEARELNLFRQQMLAGPAKRIAVDAFGFDAALLEDPVLKETPLPTWPYLCPRQLVIDVANWYRDKYGGSIWARRWENEARAQNNKWGCHVITDMRFPEEVAMLQRNNGFLVYIQRDEAEEALLKAQKAGDQMASNVSESHYEMLKREANCTVMNNGTIAQLHNSVVAATRIHFGHWSTWPDIKDLDAWFQKDRISRGIL